jgi:hypothetical protein
MQTLEAVEYARRLMEACGEDAELKAARRIRLAEEAGDVEEAETWKRIRTAIHELKPPHVS